MIESDYVHHQCPCLCVHINWEEETYFVPASDPTDVLTEISLDKHLDQYLSYMIFPILNLYHQLLTMFIDKITCAPIDTNNVECSGV